jgi:hypothetical protein
MVYTWCRSNSRSFNEEKRESAVWSAKVREGKRHTNSAESDEEADAGVRRRRPPARAGEDRLPKEGAGNSTWRSWLRQTRWAPYETWDPPALTGGAARRRNRCWPATAALPRRRVATAAILCHWVGGLGWRRCERAEIELWTKNSDSRTDVGTSSQQHSQSVVIQKCQSPSRFQGTWSHEVWAQLVTENSGFSQEPSLFEGFSSKRLKQWFSVWLLLGF